MASDEPVILVETDGPIRIVKLNRPDQLNAINQELDDRLSTVFSELARDDSARVIVITGAGRAFSAGGDFEHLKAMYEDPVLRRRSVENGQLIVRSMLRCRLPIVAAVNGPAVGLGCSLVALSDTVFMSEDTFLADPHVSVGLVAADGGALSWPSHISVMLAKEFLFTGDRIPANRAAQMGLVNHVLASEEVLPAAMAYAQRLARLPQQAIEATKRVLNLHLERAVSATIDYAFSAELESFHTQDLREAVDRFLGSSNP
jgi:enoyl-CoA hydratase